jgi:hypothetical protein
MAGFQVTLYGRFWVTAKVIDESNSIFEVCLIKGGNCQAFNFATHGYERASPLRYVFSQFVISPMGIGRLKK